MMYLTDPVLGRLDLTCVEGFVVTSFEIGWPEVRTVMNPRALSDGMIDTTRYLGARAVTVGLRLDQTKLATQDLLDRVTPFLSPRSRPTLVWTVQDSYGCNGPAPSSFDDGVRSLMVRGESMPLVIDAPKYTSVVCQWVAQESYTSALTERCAVAIITGTGEDGRVYDLDFDRDYPFSPVYGVTYFDTLGNAPMDWSGTLTSEVTAPEIQINSTWIRFPTLTLLAGQTVVIDTRERTILRNNDPNDSVYALSNFDEWDWEDLRLVPGQNQMRLEGASFIGEPSFTLCWYDRWY